MIRGILYDLGDIFFEAHYWRKWMYEKLCEGNYFSGTFYEFYNLYESYLVDVYEGNSTYLDQYFAFLAFLKVDGPKKFQKESFEKKVYFEEHRSLFAGVKETLEILKQKDIKNIVITDNELSEQEVRSLVIEKFEINHLLDTVITSKDAKMTKPDPKIFDLALNNADLSMEETIFVAHDKDEIDGAKLAGLKVVEFNNYLKIDTKADFKIDCFQKLLDFI